MPCTGALPDFIISSEKVSDRGLKWCHQSLNPAEYLPDA
jgi:hypothetical protein